MKKTAKENKPQNVQATTQIAETLDVYTVAQASAKIGVAERTIREAIKGGELKAKKTFGRWFILHTDLVKTLTS